MDYSTLFPYLVSFFYEFVIQHISSIIIKKIWISLITRNRDTKDMTQMQTEAENQLRKRLHFVTKVTGMGIHNMEKQQGSKRKRKKANTTHYIDQDTSWNHGSDMM